MSIHLGYPLVDKYRTVAQEAKPNFVLSESLATVNLNHVTGIRSQTMQNSENNLNAKRKVSFCTASKIIGCSARRLR